MGRPKADDFNTKQFAVNMAALPELCYALDPVCNRVILIERGGRGYYPVDLDKFPRAKIEPESFIMQYNNEMRVTEEQREAMIFGSMFGWDKPGADPASLVAKWRANTPQVKA